MRPQHELADIVDKQKTVILKKQLNFGHGLVSVYVSPFQGSKYYTLYPGRRSPWAGSLALGFYVLALQAIRVNIRQPEA